MHGRDEMRTHNFSRNTWTEETTVFGKYTCTREYNIKMYLNRNRAGVWTGLIRFRKGSSGSSGLV
jgi:hypothetical protein